MDHNWGIQIGQGRLRVTLSVIETEGLGLCCFLGGGELSHVGGVVLANPSPRLHSGGLTCDVWSLTVPGHKDDRVAGLVARRLCQATGLPVSVTAGLHTDRASKEEIQCLCRGCLTAAERYLEEREIPG